MPDDKILIFRRTELFRDLDDGVLEVLARHSVKKRLEKNEILFLAGEPAKGMYVIALGSVRAFRTSPDGREGRNTRLAGIALAHARACASAQVQDTINLRNFLYIPVFEHYNPR